MSLEAIMEQSFHPIDNVDFSIDSLVLGHSVMYMLPRGMGVKPYSTPKIPESHRNWGINKVYSDSDLVEMNRKLEKERQMREAVEAAVNRESSNTSRRKWNEQYNQNHDPSHIEEYNRAPKQVYHYEGKPKGNQGRPTRKQDSHYHSSSVPKSQDPNKIFSGKGSKDNMSSYGGPSVPPEFPHREPDLSEYDLVITHEPKDEQELLDAWNHYEQRNQNLGNTNGPSSAERVLTEDDTYFRRSYELSIYDKKPGNPPQKVTFDINAKTRFIGLFDKLKKKEGVEDSRDYFDRFPSAQELESDSSIPSREEVREFMGNLKYQDLKDVGIIGGGNFRDDQGISRKHLDLPDFQGSFGQSMGNANYIKKFSDGGLLSVHAPDGIITGAKYKIGGEEEILNNYQAAMHDLRDGDVKKDTGGKW